ncbi:MAG: anion permease [Acidaminococcales bacterium]|jgi:anion transporter|nr:anion permease [Acidaminococcales bacterium]
MENSTIAIIILAIAVVSFVMEKIPLAVTAMAAAVAMGIFKVMPFAAVSAGFAATVTMMVAGMMIVGDALFETGVARVLGVKIGQSRLAQNERVFTFIIVAIVCALTGFLSNSAVIAMFMPIISAVGSRSGGKISAKNITMLAGMAAAVGASITMVGSTAQLITQGILTKTAGARAIGFFEMAPITIFLCVVFCVYSATIGLNIARKSFDFAEPQMPGADKNALDEQVKFTWRMWLSSIVMLLCITGFVLNVWNVGIIGLTGATVLMATKCIDYKKAIRNLDWNTLIILGAAQGFATGLDVSGGGRVIANFVLELFGGASAQPYVLLLVAIIISCALTNFMSNTAVAAMLVPIFLPIAFALNVSPVIFAIAITITANNAISTPIGTPAVTQTLPMGYRYMDYVKVGLPINIILLILTCVFMPVFYSW